MDYPAFTCKWSGKVFHYVASETSEAAVDRTVIDFGIKDSKGRAVAYSRAIRHVTVKLMETAPASGGRLHPADAPLVYFKAIACPLRDGQVFGSSYIEVRGSTAEEVAAEMDRRIARARAASVKKHTAAAEAA